MIVGKAYEMVNGTAGIAIKTKIGRAQPAGGLLSGVVSVDRLLEDEGAAWGATEACGSCQSTRTVRGSLLVRPID